METDPLEFITDQAMEKLAEKALDTVSDISDNDDDVLIPLFKGSPGIEKAVFTCVSLLGGGPVLLARKLAISQKKHKSSSVSKSIKRLSDALNDSRLSKHNYSQLSPITDSLQDLRELAEKIEKLSEYYPGAGLRALFHRGIPGYKESLDEWLSIHSRISSHLEELFPEFSRDHHKVYVFYFDAFEGPLQEWVCADDKTISMQSTNKTLYLEIERLETFLVSALAHIKDR